MPAVAQGCFCCSKPIGIDEKCFAVPMPMTISTVHGNLPFTVFAHKRCAKSHGKAFQLKAVEWVLCTVLASTLSRAEAVETTPNAWAGAQASKAIPARPHVAIVA